MEQAKEGGEAVADPLMEEEDEEEDQRRGSSTAGRVAPLQVPELVQGGPMWPGMWFLHQGAWKAGWGPPTSEKAWGKAPAVEPPPPEMDKELARQLQEKENEVEQMQWGQDAATLVVVREAAGLLTRGQVEGLGGPS